MSFAAVIPFERLAEDDNFVPLRGLAGLEFDLRYGTASNPLGRDLYGGLDTAWLHREGALKLARAIRALQVQRPDLRLRVLDALRPNRVQRQLWIAVVGTPRETYLAPPSRGSMHSFGMAIDVTLADSAGAELDMGTGFDDFSERSHPDLEPELLASGALTAEQLARRRLLRAVMVVAGFSPIGSEWWHFDAGDRTRVRREFTLVE